MDKIIDRDTLKADTWLRVEATRKRASDLQARIAALVAEAEGIVAELPSVQGEIYRAATTLYMYSGCKVADFADRWAEVGGTNPALGVFPETQPGSLARDLLDLLQRRAGVVIYDPARGAANYPGLTVTGESHGQCSE